MTTVLRLTVRVVVVTVTPEAVVVATERVTRGPVAAGVPVGAAAPAAAGVLTATEVLQVCFMSARQYGPGCEVS